MFELDPWWPAVGLAVILAGDIALMMKPPKFITDCLDGVGYPRDWWWILIAIKVAAVIGLITGLWVPGFALASAGGVVAYFIGASIAHIRARFVGRSFWINCLGMLAISSAVFVTYAVGYFASV